MIKIAALMAVSVFLAYYSQRYTEEVQRSGHFYSVLNDRAYLLLVLVFVLFAGLRREYNDTWNYLNAFRNNAGLGALLSNPDKLHLFENPLFEIFRSALRDVTSNDQMMIFIPSAFTQICYLYFFKRYSQEFTFSVFLYVALGSFNITLAAMKQVWAMAIMTLAFPCLEKKQWGRYYVIVFIAMLMHTYALAYAVLPLFMQKPWKAFTYLFVLMLVVVMMNFEESITAFMEQAEEVGKTLHEEVIFHDHGVNILRVAVYAVVPLISFFFQKWLFAGSSPSNNVLVHMSIISFAFMLMGTQSGANMFARMANYFELGTICCLPWMLKKIFDKRSYRVMRILTASCFLAYFVYANGINSSFDAMYRATNVFALFGF